MACWTNLYPKKIEITCQILCKALRYAVVVADTGPDRSITWRPWHQNANHDFRFRTGDQYLGRSVWERYLGFEQNRTSSKAIKLSMIRLGSEAIPEEVVIRPGLRYAIVKVTNDTMTAHKGMWNWTAQEVATELWLSAWSLAKQI